MEAISQLGLMALSALYAVLNGDYRIVYRYAAYNWI